MMNRFPMTILLLSTISRLMAGTLDIAITSDQGRPASFTSVTIQRVAEGAGISKADILFSRTDEGGKASVVIPKAGAWMICAGAPSKRLLNSCQWTDTPPIVAVRDDADHASTTIVLRTGVLLTFRIDDPEILLKEPLSDSGGTAVNVGVITTKGRFYSAFPASSEKLSVTYELLVPEDVDLIESVEALNAQVVGDDGVALQSKDPQTIRTSASELSQLRHVRLTAIKQ